MSVIHFDRFVSWVSKIYTNQKITNVIYYYIESLVRFYYVITNSRSWFRPSNYPILFTSTHGGSSIFYLLFFEHDDATSRNWHPRGTSTGSRPRDRFSYLDRHGNNQNPHSLLSGKKFFIFLSEGWALHLHYQPGNWHVQGRNNMLHTLASSSSIPPLPLLAFISSSCRTLHPLRWQFTRSHLAPGVYFDPTAYKPSLLGPMELSSSRKLSPTA